MQNYTLQATSLLAPNLTEFWHGYTRKKDATRAKHREIAKMKATHSYFRAWKFKVIKVKCTGAHHATSTLRTLSS